MGRSRGGAETILLPEEKYEVPTIIERLKSGTGRGKKHSIIIVAEGVMPAAGLAELLKQEANIETHVSVLGHIQRGGSPSARDRVIASQYGARAVEILKEGRGGIAIGMKNHTIVDYDLQEVFEENSDWDLELYALSKELSI